MLSISSLIPILELMLYKICQELPVLSGISSLPGHLQSHTEKYCCLPSEAFEKFRFTTARFSTLFLFTILTVRFLPLSRGNRFAES